MLSILAPFLFLLPFYYTSLAQRALHSSGGALNPRSLFIPPAFLLHVVSTTSFRKARVVLSILAPFLFLLPFYYTSLAQRALHSSGGALNPRSLFIPPAFLLHVVSTTSFRKARVVLSILAPFLFLLPFYYTSLAQRALHSSGGALNPRSLFIPPAFLLHVVSTTSFRKARVVLSILAPFLFLLPFYYTSLAQRALHSSGGALNPRSLFIPPAFLLHVVSTTSFRKARVVLSILAPFLFLLPFYYTSLAQRAFAKLGWCSQSSLPFYSSCLSTTRR